MKTKDGTYRCEKCGREWHVLVNADPLVKLWERYAPRVLPGVRGEDEGRSWRPMTRGGALPPR